VVVPPTPEVVVPPTPEVVVPPTPEVVVPLTEVVVSPTPEVVVSELIAPPTLEVVVSPPEVSTPPPQSETAAPPAPEITAPAPEVIPAPVAEVETTSEALSSVPEVVVAPPAPEIPVAPVIQRPIIQYVEEPTLSALRVRTEKEQELKNVEEYWKDRLLRQEAAHAAQASLSDAEIAKNAKDIETLFKPAASRDICRDGRQAVQDCYSSNPKKTLICRDQVLEFSKCVRVAREQVLTTTKG